MGGNIYSVLLDDWEISWESQKEYRHWCIQKKTDNKKTLLVIMFNPGSLSGTERIYLEIQLFAYLGKYVVMQDLIN